MTYKKFWINQEHRHLKLQLKTYTGDTVEVMGSLDVTVCFEDHSESLSLLLVTGKVKIS